MFSFLCSWTSGYHGQPIAFADQTVLFYAIDDGLRFLDFTDPENQKCSTIQLDGMGVGAIVCSLIFQTRFFYFFQAGNADMHLFAFADYQNPPVIHLHEYPSFNEIKKFTDAAEFEYSAVEFSTTDELLALSSAPDYLLTVWNWRTGHILAQCETSRKQLVEISFNPNSWYDIAILYRDQINFYTCERRNEKYVLFERQLMLELFNQSTAHNQPMQQQSRTKESDPERGMQGEKTNLNHYSL